MIRSLHTNLLAMNRIGRGSVRPQLIGIAVFALLMAMLPLAIDGYWERLLVFMFVNIALASAWNVIGGVAGYPSFGHGLFFGLGAYASAMLVVKGGFGIFPAIVGAGVVAACFSVLFIPLLRQKGLYFALSTLSAQLAVETIVRAWSFTRGQQSWDMGWNFPDLGSLHFFYFLTLGLLCLCLVSIVLLLASRVGYALRAIHKDEIVAASVGVPTVRYKALAFVFSAAWPGILGGAYGPFLVYISPDNVFSLSITLNMVLITIFGGLGTIVGPVIGGIVLTFIDQLAWANFLEYHHMIYGMLIVVVITFWPGGLASIIEKKQGPH
jgi:branched-chain amino acid transport system permease protein